jgi:UDP:flavonoid glycosyltransferase YjiC (YdhE family)
MNSDKDLKKRLFFAVPGTLVHVPRSIEIIEMISDCNFDIYLATGKNYFNLFRYLPVTFLSLNQNNLKNVKERIEKGQSPFSSELLENQITEDLEIIDKINPQIIFGDLRNSLSVIARLRKKIYINININNAYWSPNINLPHPIPWNPLVNILPKCIFRKIFRYFGNLIMILGYYAAACSANRVLKRVNMKFTDFRDFYTDGDFTLFFDFPELIPLKKMRPNQKVLGPLIWSYKEDCPSWLEDLDKSKKKILISLGSSWKTEEISKMLQALEIVDAEIILVSDDEQLKFQNKKVHVARSFPLKEVMPSVDVLICNGGAPTSYMGLSFGVSVLGIVSNNDQILSMSHIGKFGAGILLRYQQWTAAELSAAVTKLIFNKEYKTKAIQLQQCNDSYGQKTEIVQLIRKLWIENRK